MMSWGRLREMSGIIPNFLGKSTKYPQSILQIEFGNDLQLDLTYRLNTFYKYINVEAGQRGF